MQNASILSFQKFAELKRNVDISFYYVYTLQLLKYTRVYYSRVYMYNSTVVRVRIAVLLRTDSSGPQWDH